MSASNDRTPRPIRPDDVRGRFTRARRALHAGLIVFWIALPFIPIAGRPAVLIDIPARRFFLFGAVLTARDFWMAVFLVGAFAVGLLFFTAWLGRVWCGFACPQTVFLEGVYRRVERLVEGNARRAPTLPRTIIKHAIFLLISVGLAFVTMRYFGGGSLFWLLAFVLFFELNFTWFREQTCIVCPYGRLQAALTDRDSIVLAYDVARGEPRGRRRAGGHPVGDCTDCRRCVRVCPTGIDIRNGLQLECLACAQCIDACDEVMVALKRPRGLIRFDRQGKKVVRPRLIAYGALFAAALTGVVITQLSHDGGVEAALLRGQGPPYVLDGASVRNQLQLHLVNREPTDVNVTIAATSAAPAELLVAQPAVHLPPSGTARVPIFVTAGQGARAGFDITVTVTSTGKPPRELHTTFLAP